MTWCESPFQGWPAVQWKGHRSRRADRAPGRGRAGECPSSRLGLTGRFLFFHGHFVIGVASHTLMSFKPVETIFVPSGLNATLRTKLNAPEPTPLGCRPSVMISWPDRASQSLIISSFAPV